MNRLTSYEAREIRRVFTELKNTSRRHFDAAFYFVFGFRRAAQLKADRFEDVPMPGIAKDEGTTASLGRGTKKTKTGFRPTPE